MKNYKVKVTYTNGFGIIEQSAKSFANACLAIEKKDARDFRVPIAFENVTNHNHH